MKLVALVLLVVACGGAEPRGEQAGAKSSATAARTVRVPSDVGALVVDRDAFARFAAELRAMLSEAQPDELFVLAMLDALDEKWPGAVAKLDRIAAMSPGDPANVMRGLSIRVWADAVARESNAAATSPDGVARSAAFRAALAARVDALPKDRVASLSELRAMAVVFTRDVCRQLVRDTVGPRVSGGTVPIEDAHAIVFQRYAVVRLVPVGKDIDEVLAARGIELPPSTKR